MLNSQINKIQAITSDTLIVGVDIAKNIQWAQFINFRGIEVFKHICFENNYSGFNSIMEKIEEIKSKNNFLSVIVGMEPTGHYWKTFATFLHNNGIKVVQVNPYHTKKAKELDTTKQNKNLWAYPLYGSYYFVKGPQAPETKALAADAGYEE